jgi:hypothetical protein
MSYIQNYPLLKPLDPIARHDQLPPGTIELGQCLDTTEREKLHTLVKHQNHLSVLVSYIIPWDTGDEYYCDQYDYPLRTLSWFPWALEEFQKPPIEGGLHAGAMVSKDMDVDGEMLAVGRTTDGYCLTNWSRNYHKKEGSIFRPTEISLSSHFLYNLGFLDLWKSLGEKYERGEI